MSDTPYWLVPDGWHDSEICPEPGRDGVRLLFYGNDEVRVEHKCLAGDGHEAINAPVLSEGHSLRRDGDGRVTVSPSILCKGCGLHGFVERSKWRSV